MTDEKLTQEGVATEDAVAEKDDAVEQSCTICEMTFGEYDEFIERATEIELYGLRPYWPAPKDIAEKGVRFATKELVLMFSWLLEMNPAPATDEEKTSYKAMKQYVYDHLKLVPAAPAN